MDVMLFKRASKISDNHHIRVDSLERVSRVFYIFVRSHCCRGNMVAGEDELPVVAGITGDTWLLFSGSVPLKKPPAGVTGQIRQYMSPLSLLWAKRVKK